MYQVHARLDRADAERLSDILAELEPSPASAVSIQEITRTAWSLDAFCMDQESANGAASIIQLEVPGVSASVQQLEDKDWVTESLSGLPAVSAGPFYVAGAHELTGLADGRIPVWIEAGPAFGTGHHGTTKGCLEALAKELKRSRPKNVLDIGTGSAVLAIAAVKGGAARALGTDIDAESIRVANENRINNRVGRSLKLLVADGANHHEIRDRAPYDLIMANILARPLVSLSKDIARLVAPGGRVILSGLLNFQEPQVRAAYVGRGLRLVDRRRINGWSTLVFERARPSKAKTAPARSSRAKI